MIDKDLNICLMKSKINACHNDSYCASLPDRIHHLSIRCSPSVTSCRSLDTQTNFISNLEIHTMLLLIAYRGTSIRLNGLQLFCVVYEHLAKQSTY